MTKFKFKDSYGRNLGLAYHLIFKRLAKLMKEEDLPITPDQFRVLAILWDQDGCSQQELAKGSSRDRANVTRIIDILEREGIVKRVNHELDRRMFRIYLTDLGRNLEKKAAKCAQQSILEATKGIDKADLDICMDVLKKTIQNLR